MDLSLVRYRAQNIGNYVTVWGMDNHLRVLQEYQFTCLDANISSLILGIKTKGNTSMRYFPSVKILRPNQNYRQYDLVAGSERYIYYSTSNYSTSGLLEYPLNPPIPVKEGDLLAVSQPPAKESVVIVSITKAKSFLSHRLSRLQGGEKTLNLPIIPVTNNFILVYPKTSGWNCCNNSDIMMFCL